MTAAPFYQRLALLIVVLALWQAIVTVFHVSPVLLPSPVDIGVRLYELIASGQIWPHLVATSIAVLSGFVIGSIAGIVIGATISLIPAVERLVYPYVVALQTMPKVAIAPLLLLWFGYGLTSKIVIAALVCFFPVLVSVMAGFNSADVSQLEMMKSFGATRWQTLMYLRVPSALVMIFAGLEIAAVFAVIGAVVGEFVGAQRGLGYLLTVLNFNLDVAGVFAVLIILSLIGVVIHAIVKSVGRRCVFWAQSERVAFVS